MLLRHRILPLRSNCLLLCHHIVITKGFDYTFNCTNSTVNSTASSINGITPIKQGTSGSLDGGRPAGCRLQHGGPTSGPFIRYIAGIFQSCMSRESGMMLPLRRKDIQSAKATSCVNEKTAQHLVLRIRFAERGNASAATIFSPTLFYPHHVDRTMAIASTTVACIAMCRMGEGCENGIETKRGFREVRYHYFLVLVLPRPFEVVLRPSPKFLLRRRQCSISNFIVTSLF